VKCVIISIQNQLRRGIMFCRMVAHGCQESSGTFGKVCFAKGLFKLA
jgi:hypothetical protein